MSSGESWPWAGEGPKKKKKNKNKKQGARGQTKGGVHVSGREHWVHADPSAKTKGGVQVNWERRRPR